MKLPEYPIECLKQARKQFYNNWQRLLNRNSTARRITRLHNMYPPLISLINTYPYPFEESDVYHPNSTNLLARDREISYDNSLNCSKVIKKRSLTHDDISKVTQMAVSKAKRAMLTQQSKIATDDENSEPLSVYNCDVCETVNMTRDEAEDHVKHNDHQSCSQYIFGCQTDGNNDADSTGKTTGMRKGQQLLLSPRNVFHQRNTNYGWNEGDCVIYCPVCHLITPDKVICAFHHQLSHPGKQAMYAIGRVLKGITLEFNMNQLFCFNCKLPFSDMRSLLRHWSRFQKKCSPFKSNIFTSHAVNFKCEHCNLQRARTIFMLDSKSQLGRVNDENVETNDKPSTACHFMGVNFTNHLKSHFVKTLQSHPVLKFRFRFIRLGISPKCKLPDYAQRNTYSCLLAALNELKQLQILLKSYKNSNKSQLALINTELDRIKEAIAHIACQQ